MAFGSSTDALRARERSSQMSTASIQDADGTSPCSARANLPAQSTSDAVPEAVAPQKGGLRSAAARQSVATTSGGRSRGSVAMAAATGGSMDPIVVSDDVAKAALLDMGIGDDVPDLRPTRAAALRGRARTRLMSSTGDHAACDLSEGASTSRSKAKESKAAVLKGPKRIPKNTKPLSQFAWDIPLDEELGSPAFKKLYRKEIKTVRIERNMADKFDPHTPHQVNLNKLDYAMRVRRATEQWPTSDARDAPDDMDTLVANEMSQMPSPLVTQDLEEETDEQAERVSLEQPNDCNENVDNGSNDAASGGNNTRMREASNNEADEFADLSSADEDSLSHYTTGHPDIPRSFNEDFSARRAAAAARPQDAFLIQTHNNPADSHHHVLAGVYPVATPFEAPPSNIFNQPPPGNYGFKQPVPFASRQPPYSIHNLPPSINDRAAQEAAYAADFPWRLQPAGILACVDASPDTLSKARARREEVRQIAEKIMDEKDAIEAADTLTGRAPFTRPYRMHDFDYDNLVASGHIGGPKATAKQTQQQPNSRKRVVDKDETLDESGNQAMDLMVNQLGLELEPMPPPRECFSPLTGPWADLPDHLTGRSNPNLQ